jgi:hypothetical protein
MTSIRSPSGKEFQRRQDCTLSCELQILINGGGDLNECLAICKKGYDDSIGAIRRGLE